MCFWRDDKPLNVDITSRNLREMNRKPVGAGLPAIALVQAQRVLDVPPSSQASLLPYLRLTPSLGLRKPCQLLREKVEERGDPTTRHALSGNGIQVGLLGKKPLQRRRQQTGLQFVADVP